MGAVFNGLAVAESDDTIVVEGNHYFPPESVRFEHLRPTRVRTLCLWKGVARYYTVHAGEAEGRNAAWAYPRPWPWIRKIRRHVAFWDGVELRPSTEGTASEAVSAPARAVVG